MARAPMRELLAKDLAIVEVGDGEQWGIDRNDGIGGSEAGSVLGLNKYHTALDLLQEKVTRTPLREFTEAQQLRLDVGHAQEALVLKTFARRELGLAYTTSLGDLERTDALAHLGSWVFVNPRYQFAFAHVDGLYRLGDEIGIVDAKTSFRDPWTEVPEYYVAQLAHYNAVLGGNVGYIAAMFQVPPYPLPMEYRFDFTPGQLSLVRAPRRSSGKASPISERGRAPATVSSPNSNPGSANLGRSSSRASTRAPSKPKAKWRPSAQRKETSRLCCAIAS